MLTFQPLEKNQINQLRLMRNKPEIWKNLSNSALINQLEQENWFASQSLDPTKQYFAIMQDNKMAGCMWYHDWDRINSSCRVGIFIHPKFQQQNIGYHSLKTFIKYLHEDLNIHRIWLLVLKYNKPAIKLYKKLGFIKEGTQSQAVFRDGRYHDYLMMGKVI